MIIISYGQPKSASTFMVHLLKQACELRGSSQNDLRDRIFSGEFSQYKSFLGEGIKRLTEIHDRMNDGEYLAIKTHSKFDQNIRSFIEERKALAFVSYRHPGDAALSAFEAGASERAVGKNIQFARLDTHRKAIDNMIGHVDQVTVPWIKSGLAHSFSYQQVTQDSDDTVRRIAKIFEIDASELLNDSQVSALLSGEKRVYNFNKGVSGRYVDVFSPEDRAYLEEKCADFIRFCNGEIDVDSL